MFNYLRDLAAFFFLPFPLTFSVALLVVFDMRILSKYLLPVLLFCVSALTVSSFCNFYDFFFLHGPNYVTRLPTCLNTYIEFPFGRTSHARAVSSSRQSLRRGFLVDLKEVSGFRCECVYACWWFTAVVTFYFVIFVVLYICFKLKKVATFA